MGDQYPVVKVAAVQACPVFLNREATTEKACRLIREAGKNGARVIAFPEGFIPTHPVWLHFHGGTGPIARSLTADLFKNSVVVPGPETEHLARAAQDANAWVMIGCCEKRPVTTGTMYNTYLFFSPEGELVFKHQKLMPTSGERIVHAPGGRETMGEVQTEFGPISALLCSENSNPLAIFSTLMGGTMIHAAAWPNFWGVQVPPIVPMRHFVEIATLAFAQMAKCFVLSPCSTVDEEMIQRLKLSPEREALVRSEGYTGGTMIAAPAGILIAGPMGEEEGILYADCDLEMCLEPKMSHDFAGHYNRSDMFTLIHNKTPQPLYVVEQASYKTDVTEKSAIQEEQGSPE